MRNLSQILVNYKRFYSKGQHSVEMDTAEISETGDLSVGSQREHASDSTESSSSESEGKSKSDNDNRPETTQARSDSLPEDTRTSYVSSGEHSVEMDTAEISETGDLSAGIISKGSQREHASDSTESSSSESELEREKERLLAEDKRLTRSHRKQQLRAEINELQASVEDKKVKKQNVSVRMEGKSKSDNDKRPETTQARLDSLPEDTRTSYVSSGQHSVEMDTAEISETGDLSAGIISKGSQREHASDSTESSSSESELEREKERLLAEEKRLTRSHRKQQLRAEVNELKASVEDKKVQKQNFSVGMEGKSKSDNDNRPETTQARLDSPPEDTRPSYVSSVTGMSGGNAENCNITGQSIQEYHLVETQNVFNRATPAGTVDEGGVPQAVTQNIGTQNVFPGPTPAGTVGEATLVLQIRAAEEVFVEAEAFRTAKIKLKEFGHVTICGASGEGKTTTALMLGSQYRRNGYKLAFVDRIDQFDLDSFLRSAPRVFLIIDDMFGSVGLSTDVSQLKPCLSKLVLHLQRCKKALGKQHSLRNHPAKKGGEKESTGASDPAQLPSKDIRVVFTSKTYNFQVGLDQMQYEGFSLFKGQTVVDITTQTKHRYTQVEKKAIFEKHRNLHNENDTDYEDMLQGDLWDADSVFGFPLTCKIFFENPSFSRHKMNFFKEPLFYLRLELKSLLASKTDRSAILVLMLLCEEKLDLAKLESAGKDQVLDNMIRNVLELFPIASCAGMYEASKSFRGTYFTHGDTVGFAHSSIHDACACALYKISPTFVLTHCSDNFIYERVQPQPAPATEIDEHLHVIYISESYYDILTTRFAKSIKDGHFSKSVTHPILQQDQIVLQLLEKLQPDESIEESWFHKREMGQSFLFWTVLGHSSKFPKYIEKKTGEEFTQIEIIESFAGCVFKNNVALLKWLFSRCSHQVVGVTINSLLLLSASHGSSETLLYLLEEGGDTVTTAENYKTIIHKACRTGQQKILNLLKEHNSDLFQTVVMNSVDDEGKTPLMEAAQAGSNGCYKILKSMSKKNIRDKSGNAIVHCACLGGNIATVRDILSSSNINSRGQYGRTPVMVAACQGHKSVFDLLRSKKADLTLVDDHGNGLLHHACIGGNTDIAQHAVSPSNRNTRGQDGHTPVMVAACHGHQSVFDLLVSKKADLTLMDDPGDSLLHHACIGGNTVIVQHVLSPSNINTRGQGGHTPVMVAACQGHKSVFDLLRSKKADLTLVDDHGNGLLHHACIGGNTDIAQIAVSPSNSNTRGQDGHTPVMATACHGHQSVFDLLVSRKADLTLLDDHGDSLLHHACEGGNTAIVQHVLSPSNINTRGQDGHTPVMVAACQGHESVFDLLVPKKADLTLVDDHEDSLLHHACRGGNTAIVQHAVSPSNINTGGQHGLTPVMIAAGHGHQSVFDLLVSEKADLTLDDGHGNSLLHLACKGGNTAIVQHVLSPSNINTRGQDGLTPVMIAAGHGHQSVFDLLVSEKADLTLVDDHGNSLLRLASDCGNTAIVQLVLSPSNINTRGKYGFTPVMVAAAAGHQSVFDLLVSEKADLTLVDDYGISLFRRACDGGNTAIVQHVFSSSDINTRGPNGDTPVMIAASLGYQRLFDLLVSKKADLTLVDDHGNNLLHRACNGGNTAIVQHVLSPFNINTRGQFRDTPVMVAARRGHKSVFDLLVSKKADLTLMDDQGDSLLHLACDGGNTAIVQHVLSPSNINTRGRYGYTPVMKAAEAGQIRLFDIVSATADLTLMDDYGNSLLHHACDGGNTAIVQHVLSPSNINTRGHVGRTPVIVAACKGHKSVFDLLVSKKADLTLVDGDCNSLLHLACVGGNTAIVQHLVSPSNINTRGQYGHTPVMVAAGKGHQRVFDLLVSKKADLTLVDGDCNSLLHLACAGGNTAIVQHLVSPSNINTRGAYRLTPVMVAACEGHKSVFDLLVSKKADLSLMDDHGDSLLHLACAGGNTAIVQHVVSSSNINTRGQYRLTPVMVAACKGHKSVFDLLVSKKADLSLVDDQGDSLLHHACVGGNTAIVQHCCPLLTSIPEAMLDVHLSW
ncbi:uncharacterized protein LOC124111218 isoform X3 [Haliotis rufescens]|uniref:uncharacterized protein LOC124111218 isoform X3 n=1 Tax=Haliotis rufescens TaxID=6454 RepID=UPI00201F8311|nr:uncharacterized protein LOC124111218 isoform X3 [Haliotis rufescens]